MEKEKLIIKNFGPIKSVELDLGRFNILIGEQATGKSTVAKVLAVCRYFSYIVSVEAPEFRIDIFKHGLAAWGLKEYVKNDTYISYSCKHYSLIYERFTIIEQNFNPDDSVEEYERGEFTFDVTPISIEFKNLLEELEKIKPREGDFVEGTPEYDFGFIGWTIPTSFFLNDVKNVMDNPFYLPTERGLQSIFSIGQNSIANLSDALFNQFSRLDGIARLFKKEAFIEPLNIYYININGQGFIRKANETEFYSLYNAASGYQSIIPVVLVIKYYNEIRKRSKTFLIEEPELNLFPSAQNKLMQYIVDMSNKHDNNILFTTQSPYTLTSVNNMMFACQVGKIDSSKASNIINEKYWISYENVSAYLLKADGTAENIMDDEVKQIKAEKIDEISRQFNKEYDEMLDIKYPGK